MFRIAVWSRHTWHTNQTDSKISQTDRQAESQKTGHIDRHNDTQTVTQPDRQTDEHQSDDLGNMCKHVRTLHEVALTLIAEVQVI